MLSLRFHLPRWVVMVMLPGCWVGFMVRLAVHSRRVLRICGPEVVSRNRASEGEGLADAAARGRIARPRPWPSNARMRPAPRAPHPAPPANYVIMCRGSGCCYVAKHSRAPLELKPDLPKDHHVLLS